jgi:glucuronokinase
MGNPSDGFFGKTVAVTMSNFCAEAWIWESAELCLLPHPMYDVSVRTERWHRV